jgi:multiple sugar transport system permease protein
MTTLRAHDVRTDQRRLHPAGSRGLRPRRWLATGGAYLFLGLGALTMVIPFIWMVSTSLKVIGEVFAYPPQWIPATPQWSNYVELFHVMPFRRYFLNTLYVSLADTALELTTCSLAAYAFARMEFPGRDKLFLMYLATMMIPGQVTLIPRFIIMRYLKWIDTYRALIIPAAFSAFGTFLVRQYFLTLPPELDDAARMDGCSSFGIYWRVILPLATPILATLAIIAFMSRWNDLLWPLVIINSAEKRTLTVGLAAFVGEYSTNWPALMAGTTLSILPILTVYVLGQNYFVRSIALTGMGGR